MNNNKQRPKKNWWIFLGSVIVTIGAILAVPKVIAELADFLYQRRQRPTFDKDDWGPEIVKR